MAENTFQHDIFLSYASEDRERITGLVKALEVLGWGVWWDRKIPTGVVFSQLIEAKLEASRTIVVVWSQKSVKSHWVHTEAAEGLSRKVLFPVLFDDVKIPLEFKRIHAVNLVHWQGEKENEQWKLLDESLAVVLGQPKMLSLFPNQKGQKRTGKRAAKTSQEKRAKKPTTKLFRPATIQAPKEMVLIPKGPFLYGDDRIKENITYDFSMDRHPVTNAQFEEFFKAGGYEQASFWSEEGWEWRNKEKITSPESLGKDGFNQSDQPVVEVSYFEAEAYAKWAGKRLPTDQEWEKAVRGTEGRVYPWGEEFDANGCANSVKGTRERTTPVGTFPEGASPYGCEDMAGNVWEWCANWNDADKDTRVQRGGSWINYNRGDFRCANRHDNFPSSRSSLKGFRCAQDAP